MGCASGRPVVSTQIRDRQSGKMIDEKVPAYLLSIYKLLYCSPFGRSLVQLGVSKKLLSRSTSKRGPSMDDPKSVTQIDTFCKVYGVNVDEAEKEVSEYKTFNEFFSRKLKPGLRPIADPADDNVIVSPADCRLLVFSSVADSKIWLKGAELSVSELLGPELSAYAELLSSDCTVAIARLAPQDYHRWHMPVSAALGPVSLLAGTYFSVSPHAVTRMNVLGRNARTVCVLHTGEDRFGDAVMVPVGAALVGSIKLFHPPGSRLDKGAEHGTFLYGGSTIVLLFQKGSVRWDDDLLESSKEPKETYVRMGDRIGVRAPGAHKMKAIGAARPVAVAPTIAGASATA